MQIEGHISIEGNVIFIKYLLQVNLRGANVVNYSECLTFCEFQVNVTFIAL